MKVFDAAVIGGGVLGCLAARNLTRYRMSSVLIEAEEDVCTGITRANTAIVYSGYDHHPGSRKAEMTVRSNAAFGQLCEELEVPFSRCGSLLAAFGPQGERKLREKYRQGLENGVPGLRILSGDEARAIEPMLSKETRTALYAPTTGTVNPWQLGIAAFENARANGCETSLSTRVLWICAENGMYRIGTTRGEILSRTVINCAGINAAAVQRMVVQTGTDIRLDGTDFLVFDTAMPRPEHILFEELEDGKGVTAVPCTEGNLLLDSPPRPYCEEYATTREGIASIRKKATRLLPALDFSYVIRSFGAVRPNPVASNGRDIRDFCIENPLRGFYSLIGVKTPGLTCADMLGAYLASLCARELSAERNESFEPFREAITACSRSPVVCQCENIGEDEVREAIARGAVSADGVKRRVGTGMGHCQGSRCAYRIGELLRESGYGGSV